MPRITLERQLELLHGELSAAIPSKTDQYDRLLVAAENLKRERLLHIPELIADNLKREFSIATDGELQGRFKHIGDLIVSAVCDEAAGVNDAVTSILPWLTDPERFKPQWIDAVSNIVNQARASVISKNKP
jgi:hypothetical protein